MPDIGLLLVGPKACSLELELAGRVPVVRLGSQWVEPMEEDQAEVALGSLVVAERHNQVVVVQDNLVVVGNLKQIFIILGEEKEKVD